jgi:hypothetical protein
MFIVVSSRGSALLVPVGPLSGLYCLAERMAARDTAAASLQRSNILQAEGKWEYVAMRTRVLVVIVPCIIDAKKRTPGDAPEHPRLAAGAGSIASISCQPLVTLSPLRAHDSISTSVLSR